MVFPLLAALGFAVRDNLSRWGLRDYADPLAAAAAATVTSVAVMWLVALLRRKHMRLAARGLGWVVAWLAEGIAYLTMWKALAQGGVGGLPARQFASDLRRDPGRALSARRRDRDVADRAGRGAGRGRRGVDREVRDGLVALHA